MTHEVGVTRLRFSPNGDRLAVACADNQLHVYDWKTALPLGPPLEHPATVEEIVFLPSGGVPDSGSRPSCPRVADAGRRVREPTVTQC